MPRTHGTPDRTPVGKWVIYNQDGDAVERWPVDAKGMVASGEFSAQPPGTASAAEDPEPATNAPAAVGGYRIEKEGAWWKVYDARGQQVGKATRDEQEALAQAEAAFKFASRVVKSIDASPAKPVDLPPPRI